MPILISEERITSLKVELEKEVFAQLVNIYSVEIRGLLFNLEEQVTRKKADDSMKIAHSIKGISSNMGAIFIRDIANEIEQFCKESKFDKVLPVLGDLKLAVHQTLQEMNRLI